MAAIANSPSFAKKAGVPQSVGKEFNNADKGKTFKQGGDMKSEVMKKGGMPMKMKDGKKVPIFMDKGGMAKDDMKQDKGMMQKAVNKHEGRLHKGEPMTKLARGGGIETKGKTKGKMIAMKSGGKMC
jgi:hypothetical protein